MASRRTGDDLLSTRATRRQALRASMSGALGLGTAVTLGTPALAARAVLRGSARQTIKLASWFQSDPSRNAVWATLVSQFNAAQKSYKVIMGGWSAETYATEVLTQAQEARIDADLIILLPELGPRLMRLGLLAPIDDVVANVNIHPTRAHDFMRMNGHLYGLSIAEVPFAVLYNEQLFARAGIARPASTIEEWQSQLERLTHRSRQYGIWAPNASSEITIWWFQLQNYCLAYDTVWAIGQTPLLNTDRIIKCLELWKGQYTRFMPRGATWDKANTLYNHGRIAERMEVPAGVEYIKQAAPALYAHLRSAPPPWPTRKAISRLHPLAIIAGTSRMDGARAFVTFMAQPSNMARLMQGCQDVVPPFPEVWNEPSFKTYMGSQFWAAGYLKLTAVPFPDVMGDFIAYDTVFGNIVTRNLQQALHAKISVAQAMNTAQQQVVALGRHVFQ